jgi:hypothetical protein
MGSEKNYKWRESGFLFTKHHSDKKKTDDYRSFRINEMRR